MRIALFILLAAPVAASAQLKAASDSTITGFTHPESVGCDAKAKALYVSEFGSKLAPLEKDGAGYISKWSLDGKLIEKNFLPAAGGKMDKPKGIWVQGNRLWTTDIDSVWVFDLKTKKGRKVAIPGAQFANDPAVMKGALYVSDNRGDQLFKIQPADFLNMKGDPKITTVFKDAQINPNGIWPAHGGLVMVGFLAPDQPRAIFALGKDGKPKAISDPIGRLDGVYELKDKSLLVTDWNSGSLFQWSRKMGMHKLADGFKGPADFCVIAGKNGVTAYVPDLVQSQVRIIQLR
ncbi:MAG: hypothetical protein OEO84_09015 [Betaproteobacteria bacterium]|nr:hypothetical protein [Betaproteobacteria bacterium]